MRTYLKNLCYTKLDNLKETDEFLDVCDLPKLNQNEIENLNRSIMNIKTEVVIFKKVQNQNDQALKNN